MLLETEKETVCINRIVGQNEREIVVEGDVIVNDVKPDVLNIISTNGIPCIYKKEVMDGKIRIDGCINTYIIYLADDQNSSIRSLNTVLDFTQIIDMEGCKQGMTLIENINIKNIQCKVLNGRKINVKATLNLESKIYQNDSVEIISNINDLDDIQVLNSEKEINLLIGSGTTKALAKDTLMLDSSDEIAEVMRANVRIIDKDIKLSYNKVLAKADVCVSILYLTEDNNIKSIDTTIPVMGFIDIENINDNSICDLDYQIKNIIVKPDTNSTNSILFESEIEITCLTYETKTINIIDDLYSISADLNYNKKELYAISGKQNIRENFIINEQISIPEINENKIYDKSIIPNIINTTIKNNKIIYEGEAIIEIIFGSNNNINSKTINIPFNFEIDNDSIEENSNASTNIEIKDENFAANNGNIDIRINLEFNTNINKNEKLNIINEISTEESKENNLYSMVIYFVKPGDTLWKIAKKFRSTVEDIAKVNGIEDVNKIDENQQLYIPKFINKKIAV